MPKNFWWLFTAYSVIWLALFGYVFRLLSQQVHLRRDLNHLRRKLGAAADENS